MLKIAEDLHEKGKKDEALEKVENLLKEKVGDTSALMLKAEILMNDEALELVNDLLMKKGDDPVVMTVKGKILIKLGKRRDGLKLLLKANELDKAKLLEELENMEKDDFIYPLYKKALSEFDSFGTSIKKELEEMKKTTFTIPIKIALNVKVNREKIDEDGNYVKRSFNDPPLPTSRAPELLERGIISHPYVETIYEEKMINNAITLSCELISWVYDPYDVSSVKMVSRDGFPWLYEFVVRLYFNGEKPGSHEIQFDDGTILHLEQSLYNPRRFYKQYRLRFENIYSFLKTWIDQNNNPKQISHHQIDFLTMEIKKIDEQKRREIINQGDLTPLDLSKEATKEEYVENVNKQLKKFGIKSVELFWMHRYNTVYGLKMTDFFLNPHELCKKLTIFESRTLPTIPEVIKALFNLDLPLLSKEQENADNCNQLWKEVVRKEVETANIKFYDINTEFII